MWRGVDTLLALWFLQKSTVMPERPPVAKQKNYSFYQISVGAHKGNCMQISKENTHSAEVYGCNNCMKSPHCTSEEFQTVQNANTEWQQLSDYHAAFSFSDKS